MKTNRIFLLLMGIVLWVIGGIKVNANIGVQGVQTR